MIDKLKLLSNNLNYNDIWICALDTDPIMPVVRQENGEETWSQKTGGLMKLGKPG